MVVSNFKTLFEILKEESNNELKDHDLNNVLQEIHKQ